MLSLSLLMSKQRQRQRRRRRIYSRNGWVASRAKRKRPSEQDENSLGSQIKGYSGSKLPEYLEIRGCNIFRHFQAYQLQ
nr:unnamed protein product [Digitaria exilis]